MPPETVESSDTPLSPGDKMARAAIAAAKDITNLDPGPLAELRRTSQTLGAPAFWRLAARYPDTIGRESGTDRWMAILRMYALLTPTGNPQNRYSLHAQNRPLGAVLCDGGNPDWTGPSPDISELRLAQILNARGETRAVLLERVIRRIARTRVASSGVDVTQIAALALRDSATGPAKTVARAYYNRLDRAARAAVTTDNGANT